MKSKILGTVLASLVLSPIAYSAPAQGNFYDLFGSDNFLYFDRKCFTSLMGPVCVSGVKVINPQIITHKGRYFCNENLPLSNGKPAKHLSPYGESGGKVYKCTQKGWVLSHW